MSLSISPLDGRYNEQTRELQTIFSEKALICYRIQVEIEYLLSLLKTLNFKINNENEWMFFVNELHNLYDFNNPTLHRVKAIESQINHDVKSIEYYIKESIDQMKISTELKESIKPYIHFALTSQDITTLSLWLQLKQFDILYKTYMYKIEEFLSDFFINYSDVAMLSRTHGQPASPTTIGKEFMVFGERLQNQQFKLKGFIKFGGCIGNFNAHYAAYPDIDWMSFGDQFVSKFGFKRAKYTTQIDHYDMMCRYFDNIKRTNTILIDLCRDIWEYISRDYLQLKIIDTEVGSSTMPHKVNPIDFENAEGNLLMANTLLEFFSSKLPVSRLQRDLTDSTITRNFGSAFGYCIIAYKSLLKGLSKIKPNIPELQRDLNSNYIVISEALQTILKINGHTEAYELLKEFTRKNEKPGKNEFNIFIKSLNVDDAIKQQLLNIEPSTYIGKFPNKINV